MPSSPEKAAQHFEEDAQVQVSPTCLGISERGIKTAQDFAQFMSAVMSDVIAGRLSTAKAAAATRSGSALLKVVEMQYRYGNETELPGKKTLRLID